MELTENALKVLKARYLLKDQAGNVIETQEEMFRRMAQNITAAENLYSRDAALWEKKVFDTLSSLKFLPNSLLS